MAIRDVEDAIRHCRRVIERHWQSVASHETTTRYHLIDPILWALGWETHDPIQCAFELPRGQQGRVDYALKNSGGKAVILIEAKNAAVDIAKGRDKLNQYAWGITSGMAVLTNGWYWNIYDLDQRTRFDDKWVATVAIKEDSIRNSAATLNHHLRKAKWWNP